MTTAPAQNAVRLISLVDFDVATLLEQAVDEASRVAGGHLVELASQRIAMLLGDEGAAGSWPPSRSFSDAQLALLAVAEQFTLDVSAMSDDDVGGAAAHLSTADLYGFVAAVYTLELAHRLEIALTAVLE